MMLMRLDAWREVTSAKRLLGPPSSRNLSLSINMHWVVDLSRRRYVLLPAVAIFTIVAIIYAFKLEASFEVKDFFKSDSDFAISLDKLDVHVGDSGGEPAITYIQADLTNPAALREIQEFLVRLADNPEVAKN